MRLRSSTLLIRIRGWYLHVKIYTCFNYSIALMSEPHGLRLPFPKKRPVTDLWRSRGEPDGHFQLHASTWRRYHPKFRQLGLRGQRIGQLYQPPRCACCIEGQCHDAGQWPRQCRQSRQFSGFQSRLCLVLRKVPKIFHWRTSHRILRYIHEILNVVKNITNCTVWL